MGYKSFFCCVIVIAVFSAFYNIGLAQQGQSGVGGVSVEQDQRGVGVVVQVDRIYRISRGDVMDVMVMEHPEFSINSVIVLPDGTIQYPGLGSIVAAGMTPSQLKDSIEVALNRYVVNPLVTILVRKMQQESINVLGYVNRPGQYQIFERTELLSAVGLAGGVKNLRKAKRIAIIRADQSVQEVFIRHYMQSDKYIFVDIGDTIYIKEPKEVNWARLSFISTMLLAAANIYNIVR